MALSADSHHSVSCGVHEDVLFNDVVGIVLFLNQLVVFLDELDHRLSLRVFDLGLSKVEAVSQLVRDYLVLVLHLLHVIFVGFKVILVPRLHLLSISCNLFGEEALQAVGEVHLHEGHCSQRDKGHPRSLEIATSVVPVQAESASNEESPVDGLVVIFVYENILELKSLVLRFDFVFVVLK